MKHTTKVLALFLSLIMMLSVATIGSFAAEATTSTWDGVAVSSSLSGTGTEDDPYLISSAADLAYLAKAVNDGTLDTDGKYFKQTVDINLADKPWTPIGNANKTVGEGETAGTKGFSGIYDGNWKTISGLKVTDACAAFTVEVAATETTPASTETKYGGAGLFGFTKAPADTKSTVVIKNLALKGDVSVENVQNAGGLIGYSENTAVTNCYIDVDVAAKGDDKYVAGVAAYTEGAFIVTATVNAGDATITDAVSKGRVGNFTGYSKLGTAPNLLYTAREMVNCYGLGNVSLTASGSAADGNLRAGGMTGGYYNGAKVANSHFYGTFTYTNPTDVSTYPANDKGDVTANRPRVGYFAGGIGFSPANTKTESNVVGACTCYLPAAVGTPDALNYITEAGVLSLVGSGTSITIADNNIVVINEIPAVPYEVADMFLLAPEVEEEETTEEEITDDEDTTTVPEDDDETTGKTETGDNTATDDKGGDDKKDSGCASVVGGLSVIAIVAGAALVLVKKKD